MNRSAIHELEIESLRAMCFFVCFDFAYCRMTGFSCSLFADSLNSEGHYTAWIKHEARRFIVKKYITQVTVYICIQNTKWNDEFGQFLWVCASVCEFVSMQKKKKWILMSVVWGKLSIRWLHNLSLKASKR